MFDVKRQLKWERKILRNLTAEVLEGERVGSLCGF